MDSTIPQTRDTGQTPQPNAADLQHFFELLYPDVEDGWLVLSHPDPARLTPQGKPLLRSDWFDLSRTPWHTIARAGQRRAQQYDLYFGVALQRPTCEPGQFKRSRNAAAYIVPGLWFDLDLAYGHHAASALPATDAEALDFLGALPTRPSLIVHSGGGMYGYWLWKEPYIITHDVEHETIVRLSRQFTHTLVTWGKDRGWTLDALGDLARVLRPPGSVNRKYDKVVELLHEGPERYNPSDFDWLLELPTPARATHAGAALTGQPDVVVIAEHYGATLERKSQSELAGSHPQHGSSTGDNFNINAEKGLWHCWRHGTGGDALALIAVCEGLVDCEHATSGALHGDLFKRVVTIANETFQAGIQLNTAQQDARQGQNGTAPANTPRPEAHPVIISMEKVAAEPIEWLWYPYVAIGKLCIMDGDPGVGKTMWAIQLAANLSRGHPLPDQRGKPTLPCGGPAITLLIATEDGLADTIKPRLERAGADCSLVKVFNEFVDTQGQKHGFTLQHRDMLERSLRDWRPRLVIIDAIQAVLGDKVDTNRANQVKALLDPLKALAETYRCAIVAMRHPAKPGQNIAKLIHRGGGSMAFIGTARLGLFAEDHPTDPTKVLLVQSKSNAGDIGRTQIFSKKDGQFEWCGVTRINKEMLAGTGRGPEPHAFLEACFWLEQRMDGGRAWPAEDILKDASAVDIGKKPLYGAKKALGIVSEETTHGWIWILPPLPPSAPPPTLLSGVTGGTGVTRVTGVSDSVSGEEASDTPQTLDTPETPVTPDTPVTPVVKRDASDDYDEGVI
jgi:DNA repair protein RadA/Sms